jgi:epoxyqueuosine reductase
LLEAPGDFPLEYRAALGGRVYGCDECQEVCPPNRVELRRRPPADAEPDAEPWVDLVAMLDADDDELLRRFGRWYIPERDARFLRRNALVALGNVGDPRDERVTAALTAALGHPDPMIRRHASWAAERLGLGVLVERQEAWPADDAAPAGHE